MHFAKKVALLDHADELLAYITAAEAGVLAHEKRVDLLGTKNKIRVVRIRRVEPDMSHREFAIRKPGFGSPHRRETSDNVRGVWTLQRMPSSARPIFSQVLDDCLAPAA
jgi:hypothetical protein